MDLLDKLKKASPPEKAPIPLTEGSNANHTDIGTDPGASKGFGGTTTTEKFFNESPKVIKDHIAVSGGKSLSDLENAFGAGAEGKGIKDAKGSNPSGSKPTQELLITPPKPAQPKITNAIILPEQTETIKYLDIPTKQQAAMYLDLYNFVKKKVVNQTDYQSIKGKLFLKKSGWRKFINAFKISIEEIEKKVYDLKINGKEDTHAEVRVRASMPNGQTVEGVGYKSWSELYEKTLHNLVSTAWTRAVNRAVSDLVGFGEVSAEEVIDETKDGGFGG